MDKIMCEKMSEEEVANIYCLNSDLMSFGRASDIFKSNYK